MLLWRDPLPCPLVARSDNSLVQDSAAGRLRSGETLADAVASVLDVPGLAALLVNCSAPFAVGAALPKLSAVAPPGATR